MPQCTIKVKCHNSELKNVAQHEQGAYKQALNLVHLSYIVCFSKLYNSRGIFVFRIIWFYLLRIPVCDYCFST